MPLFRRTELRYQENGCRQQALGGVIEVCVLSEGGGVHAGEDNGFGYDFGVLLRFRLVDDLVGMGSIQVGVLIDKVQYIISV